MGNNRCAVLRTCFLNCRLEKVTVTGKTFAFKQKGTCNGVLHLGFHHVGVFHKQVLNLLREDFVSNPNDDILQPSNNSSISILMQHELVSVYKQRNTPKMTAVVGKWLTRRSVNLLGPELFF